MRRKLFSIFGIIAVVAFYLPWVKSCEQVESGFEILILDALSTFNLDSVSSVISGFLFLLVPIYVIFVALLSKEYKKFFGVIAGLTLWNIGFWGGIEISSMIKEWGTLLHVHSQLMAKLAAIQVLSLIFLLIFLVNWYRKKKFNIGWAKAVIILPLFGVLGFAFSVEPRYYGLWLYLTALIGLFVDAIWDGIASTRTSQESH